MIYIISKDDFLKYQTKVLERSGVFRYVNGTKSDKVKTFHSAEETFTCFIPSESLIKKSNLLTPEQKKRKLRTFYKRDNMKETMGMIAGSIINNPDVNIAIILKNSVYKELGEGIKKNFLKFYGINPEENTLIYTFDDIDSMKKDLKRVIDKRIAKIDRRIEESHSDSEREGLKSQKDHLGNDYKTDSDNDIRRTHITFSKISKDNIKSLKECMEKNRKFFEMLASNG